MLIVPTISFNVYFQNINSFNIHLLNIKLLMIKVIYELERMSKLCNYKQQGSNSIFFV